MSLLHQFDAVGHGCMRRDAVEIAQLKDAHLQRDAYFVVEFGLLAAGEVFDEVTQLCLISQAAKYDTFGEGEIPRIARFAAEQVGGISAAMDPLKYSKGDFAGGRHSSKYGRK